MRSWLIKRKFVLLGLMACLGCVPITLFAAPGTITTIAGGGALAGSAGDNGPATSAFLFRIGGIAISNSGNLYISNPRVIREVNGATGIIRTVAGNFTLGTGFSGDGGPAINAQLWSPEAIDLDVAGNLYIADNRNLRIRKVTVGANGVFDATDIITTLYSQAFTGTVVGGPGQLIPFAPTGLDIRGCGRLFFSTGSPHEVFDDLGGGLTAPLRVTGTGGAGAFNGDSSDPGGPPASQARLNSPMGLACQSGFLYIADRNNRRVRRVQLNADWITTSAGNGTNSSTGDGGLGINATLKSPSDVAVDNAGNIYITDQNAYRVRKIDGTTALISTFAGTGIWGYSGDGGPALAAMIGPRVVAVDDVTGNVFISNFDGFNEVVRMIEGPDTTGPSGTVSINGGAAQVNSRNVTLSLTCSDTSGVPNTPKFKAGTGCSQMHFSNDGGATWGAWQPNFTSFPWTLTAGDGIKNVQVQFKDNAGLVSTGIITDTITLALVAPQISLSLNAGPFNSTTNNTLTLTATTVASIPATLADVYVALQLPDGTLLVMQPDGSFSTAMTPLVANIPIPDFTGPIFNFTFTGAEPPGNYKWFAALTTPGTLNVIGTLATVPFSFAPKSLLDIIPSVWLTSCI